MPKGPVGGAMKIAMCRALPTKMLVRKLVKTSLVLGKSFENILSTMYEVLLISGQVYSHPRAWTTGPGGLEFLVEPPCMFERCTC